VDAFGTFCINPGPDGNTLLCNVIDFTHLLTHRHTSGDFRVEMRVALYTRVSTQNKGQETANQLLQLRECCEAQNWPIIREYEDHEYGGKSDRSAFQEMLQTRLLEGLTSFST